MQVTVQLPETIAQSLRARERTADVQALDRLTQELGVELRAMHPETTDPALRGYYTVEAPDDDRGARVLERLRASPLVAAAYVKPPDAMP